MKKQLLTILVAFALGFITNTANAQAVRIEYTDYSTIPYAGGPVWGTQIQAVLNIGLYVDNTYSTPLSGAGYSVDLRASYDDVTPSGPSSGYNDQNFALSSSSVTRYTSPFNTEILRDDHYVSFGGSTLYSLYTNAYEILALRYNGNVVSNAVIGATTYTE